MAEAAGAAGIGERRHRDERHSEVRRFSRPARNRLRVSPVLRLGFVFRECVSQLQRRSGFLLQQFQSLPFTGEAGWFYSALVRAEKIWTDAAIQAVPRADC